MKKNFTLPRITLLVAISALLGSLLTFSAVSPPAGDTFDYDLVATNKTSTFRKELNQAAEEGFRFMRAMGGSTSFGGTEMVAILSRPRGASEHQYEYKILATTKTGTMKKELNREGEDGWTFVGHTSKKAAFRGREVISVLERPIGGAEPTPWEYRLLATKKTSTMRKELRQAAEEGYEFLDMIITKGSFAGSEVISILRRPRM